MADSLDLDAIERRLYDALTHNATEAAIDAAHADVRALLAKVRRLQEESAWLAEEVTRQTGVTVEHLCECMAVTSVHEPVVNVRMGAALRARFDAERERDEARRALAEARGEPTEPTDAVTAFRELAAASAPARPWALG